ncbi:Zn(II)2Cys6 transcription factor [Aspergillus aculeatinus CBS 121060]|uniref:Uncharacterized protein n=1 Tax=Aspergillus aculeatinus CBS 121060 TaxID=1448322 RepID=A0ACD1H076_9EURO|nr:hypothetical protein BO66DRAFT_422525 [Aspergillus aculeatinus CBS 121060]RAH66973.1 hypothetical protein BO66DRAFT_422525 [Aspergillus aculeatinus CBS 121060]
MDITPGLRKFRISSAPKRQSQQRGLSRKSHTKSRGGCQACKSSRVKCDEIRPSCRRCCQRRTLCVYGDPRAAYSQASSEDHEPVWPGCVTGNYSHVNNCLDPNGSWLPGEISPTPRSMYLLRHVDGCLDATLTSEVGREIFNQFLLPNCASIPMLHNALLALSARHLQHLQPARTEHQKACWLHTQTATRLLREELAQHPTALGKLDAVYATALLLNMISFASHERSPSRSWVFQPTAAARVNNLSWLSVQCGLGYLARMMQQNPQQGFWRLKNERQERLALEAPPATPQDLPLSQTLRCALEELCDVTTSSLPDNNPYYIPLSIIAPMLQQDESNSHGTNSLLSFGPKISAAYRNLLLERDERALLLLMLWLELLCQADVWWITDRAYQEFLALRHVLSCSADLRVQSILSLCEPSRDRVSVMPFT